MDKRRVNFGFGGENNVFWPLNYVIFSVYKKGVFGKKKIV